MFLYKKRRCFYSSLVKMPRLLFAMLILVLIVILFLCNALSFLETSSEKCPSTFLPYENVLAWSPNSMTRQNLDPQFYVFQSKSWPADIRLAPSVGNGHLATVVHSPNILMNGFYNGFKTKSHRVSIPSPVSLNITGTNPALELTRTYSLDTRIGMFEETLSSSGHKIILRWYAHRFVLPLVVVEIFVERSQQHASQGRLQILLNISQEIKSNEIKFVQRSIKYFNTSYFYGETLDPESEVSGNQTLHLIFDIIPHALTIESDVKLASWTFLAAAHPEQSQALEAYRQGSLLRSSGKLSRLHADSWLDVWNMGRIDVKGNLAIGRAAVASIYNIFSSIPPPSDDPPSPFIGLSPSGLSWGDENSYQGHVFWDQETWMYPPVLVVHAEYTEQMLDTRLRTMSTAAQHAKKTGYLGLRYPWESGFTGIDVTPDEACARDEIHISGDIVLAYMQYWQATGNSSKSFFTKYGPVVIGIADFWISRMSYDKTKQLYNILNVMGPDEWADPVNNSAYTNMVASFVLQSAAFVAQQLGLKNSTVYADIAKKIYIPFDDTKKFHPEFDGYVIGRTIKQADVILMGFPFMWDMPEEVRQNDLKIYSRVTSSDGPAMSDSMYTIGWLQSKMYDKAVASFNKMFMHVAGDFQVWTENKNKGGATNFITGMGGYLQSLLFGFGGIRLSSEHLQVDPVLPPGCSEMNITGLDYQSVSLDLFIVQDSMSLTLTSMPSTINKVQYRDSQGKVTPLCLNRPLILPRSKGYVTVLQRST